MTQRRAARDGLFPTPHEATGHREAHASTRPIEGDVSVRELLVAGGLRGFTPKELFA